MGARGHKVDFSKPGHMYTTLIFGSDEHASLPPCTLADRVAQMMDADIECRYIASMP